MILHIYILYYILIRIIYSYLLYPRPPGRRRLWVQLHWQRPAMVSATSATANGQLLDPRNEQLFGFV